MHTCLNCKVGIMQPPPDQHPSYVQCTSCMAIELTYQPMYYQEEMHQVRADGEDDTDIIAVFGGYG